MTVLRKFSPKARLRVLKSALFGVSLSLIILPASAHYNGWKFPPSVRMQEVSGLNFGTIAPDLHAPGVVRVRANRNGFSRCGHPLLCLESGSRGLFRISSSRTRFIRIDVSDEAVLTNHLGDQMYVGDFRVRGPRLVRRNRPELIAVGASLLVGAQQPPGHYRGTYEITISYE